MQAYIRVVVTLVTLSCINHITRTHTHKSHYINTSTHAETYHPRSVLSKRLECHLTCRPSRHAHFLSNHLRGSRVKEARNRGIELSGGEMHYPDDLYVIAMQYGLKMQFNLDSNGSDVICMHLVKVLQKVNEDARRSHTLPSAIALPVHAFHTLQQQSERE